VKRYFFCAGIAVLCAFMLAGCIDSTDPILTDSQPVFGPKLRLQFFTLRKGYAHDPERADFNWNGALYVHAGGGMRDVSAFSVNPFENGDYIIEEVPAKHPRITEYALLHKRADGVFQVLAIDEMDADEPTRAAYCSNGTKDDPSACRIQSRAQLVAFARATAARKKQDGGLVLLLPVGAERAERRPERHRRR
jgi:hypothetical protein